MDFRLTEDQQIAVDSFRRFAGDEIRPFNDRYVDECVPKEDLLPLLVRLAEFGVGNGLGPAEHGGLELDPLTVGLLFEELARVSPDFCIPPLIQMETGLLLAAGSDDIHREYLGPVLRGEKIGCIGISEPAVGSNIAEIKTRAMANRAFVDNCLELHLRGELTAEDAAAAKLYTTESMGWVLDECLQLHGGYGYMWEYPIARAWADARMTRIAGGSSEIMKEIIGRDLLKQ